MNIPKSPQAIKEALKRVSPAEIIARLGEINEMYKPLKFGVLLSSNTFEAKLYQERGLTYKIDLTKNDESILTK